MCLKKHTLYSDVHVDLLIEHQILYFPTFKSIQTCVFSSFIFTLMFFLQFPSLIPISTAAVTTPVYLNFPGD